MATSNKTPRASVAIVASDADKLAAINDQKTYFESAGRAFGASELSHANRLTEFAAHMVEFGSTFDGYKQARAWFVEGAKASGYLDPDKLFERTASAARALNLIGPKPTAPTKGAQVKAAQRTEKAGKVAELTAKHTAAELVSMAVEATRKGEDARTLLDAAQAAKSSADKVARDAARDKVKALRARLSDAVARMVSANKLDALAKIVAAAEKAAPAPDDATI